MKIKLQKSSIQLAKNVTGRTQNYFVLVKHLHSDGVIIK